jgi:hypothetical protein
MKRLVNGIRGRVALEVKDKAVSKSIPQNLVRAVSRAENPVLEISPEPLLSFTFDLARESYTADRARVICFL